MVEANWIIEEVETPGLADSDLADIRRLMDDAFGDRFSEEDWSHALGGTHFVVRGGGDTIVSHAAVVDRRIEVSGDPLSTGYVEAVATHPRFQRKGLATAVMSAVAEFIAGRYRMGALSTSLEFYERLGWIRWRGQTWCREGGSSARPMMMVVFGSYPLGRVRVSTWSQISWWSGVVVMCGRSAERTWARLTRGLRLGALWAPLGPTGPRKAPKRRSALWR